MHLLWEIKNYDWFESYIDDRRYWKEAQDKLRIIINYIREEQSSKILNECLNHIPHKTGSKIRDEIYKRLAEIVPEEY